MKEEKKILKLENEKYILYSDGRIKNKDYDDSPSFVTRYRRFLNSIHFWPILFWFSPFISLCFGFWLSFSKSQFVGTSGAKLHYRGEWQKTIMFITNKLYQQPEFFFVFLILILVSRIVLINKFPENRFFFYFIWAIYAFPSFYYCYLSMQFWNTLIMF